MKNSEGQALVEFIIILPIVLLLIISIIDFANIILKKYDLQNDMDVVSDMYNDNNYTGINDYIDKKNITVSYDVDGDFLDIELNKKIDIYSPALVVVFGKTYNVNIKKSVYKNE